MNNDLITYNLFCKGRMEYLGNRSLFDKFFW